MRIAKWVAVITAAFIILFAGFIAPYDPASQSRTEPNAPVSRIHFRDEAGNFYVRPFIYARQLVDPLTYQYEEING
jgi:peptide/nickel transport system permease protein